MSAAKMLFYGTFIDVSLGTLAAVKMSGLFFTANVTAVYDII